MVGSVSTVPETGVISQEINRREDCPTDRAEKSKEGNPMDERQVPRDREVLIEAWRRHFDALLSEPLTLEQLADLFDVPRKKMSQILEHLVRNGRGERCGPRGRRWRIRISAMPPSYHQAAGMIPAD